MVGELRGISDRVPHAANLKLFGFLDGLALAYLMGRLKYSLENDQLFSESEMYEPSKYQKSGNRKANKKVSVPPRTGANTVGKEIKSKPSISGSHRKRKNRVP